MTLKMQLETRRFLMREAIAQFRLADQAYNSYVKSLRAKPRPRRTRKKRES